MNDVEEGIIKYIMLSQMKGIGPVTQNTLINIFEDIESCFAAGYEEILEKDNDHTGVNGRIGKKRIEEFMLQKGDCNLRNRSEQIYEGAKAQGIDIITRENGLFPERFENLMDMPVLLYVKGILRINDYQESVGIVGARRCTPKGKENAIDIANKAVTGKSAVISGMAKGIDSYAHTAALKSNGYTIAVLGCGADICYPKEHIKLYEKIIEQGCIISEYPPKTQPRGYIFPKRNRLIAALSDKLYVIDAGRKSGTESTVEYSKRYGRTLVKLNEL